MNIIQQFLRPEIILTVILLLMLGMRMRVRPSVSLYVAATPTKVFQTIDFHDGKIFNFGETQIEVKAIDGSPEQFEITYHTKHSGGRVRTTTALFKLTERVEGQSIRLERQGLDGKQLQNELLSITQKVTPEGIGSRLHSTYEWGPRPVIAQILARADLIGGAYRLKGLAERGVSNNVPFVIVSALVGILTALAAVVTFAFFTSVTVAALVVLSLFVHEFGHLLAFRLIGQPWGRIMFLPFLGAIAIPRLPFENQGQIVFSALMGPGVSVILALACWLPLTFGHVPYPSIVFLGLITAAVNLMNLLPVEPLDGGVALRSILAGLNPRLSQITLLALAAVIIGVGYYHSSLVIMMIGGLALATNLKQRKISTGLPPMPFKQAFVSMAAYGVLCSIHLLAMLGTLPGIQMLHQ